MFVMTSDIRVGGFSAIKANKVTWQSSVDNFADTCTITLPMLPFARNTVPGTWLSAGVMADGRSGNAVPSVQSVPFQKGDAVSVRLGYNGRNIEVFKGFVLRVNFAEQLVLECEGYAYQLRDGYFNKSYTRTTVKQLLADLTAGTDIKVSPAIDNIPLANVWFKNAPLLKVLEWLQKECCCRVVFDGEYLYAGASKFRQVNPTRPVQEVKARIGWNVVSANELKKAVAEDVQINIVEKDSKGKVSKTQSQSKRYSSVKEIKVRAGLPADFLRRAVKELQDDENYGGYEGNITLFLEPHVFKSDKVVVTDARFPERSGSYFAHSVKGSFDSNGARKTVDLKWYGEL